MHESIKKEAPAKTRAPLDGIKATLTFKIDGLKELRELNEALCRFQENGLTVRVSV